ncbi:hypothetical protein ACS0KS_003656 [Vibrio cholerae]
MTRNFLETKIKSVYDEFVDGVWCDLNEHSLNTSGYSSLAFQQKYILKYYGAYFCELYGMYEKFFKNFNGNSLNILSLGCGSGVDCEALSRVVADKRLRIDIKYVGIDVVDWSYRPDFYWAEFKLQCISSLTKDDVSDIDLFVFPKSLTEFSKEQRNGIGELIGENNTNENIYFLNTYVTDNAKDGSRVDGITQFLTINEALDKSNWKCMEDPNYYYYKTDGGWLGYNFNFFKIPDEVKPFVEELKDSCDNHNGSEECKSCDIDFIPILNSRYLAYNLLNYKRK